MYFGLNPLCEQHDRTFIFPSSIVHFRTVSKLFWSSPHSSKRYVSHFRTSSVWGLLVINDFTLIRFGNTPRWQKFQNSFVPPLMSQTLDFVNHSLVTESGSHTNSKDLVLNMKLDCVLRTLKYKLVAHIHAISTPTRKYSNPIWKDYCRRMRVSSLTGDIKMKSASNLDRTAIQVLSLSSFLARNA